MCTAAPRPFAFDTVFDGDRVIEPRRVKRVYTAEEVEAARAEAFAEGEASAVARAEAEAAQALRDTAGAAKAALSALAFVSLVACDQKLASQPARDHRAADSVPASGFASTGDAAAPAGSSSGDRAETPAPRSRPPLHPPPSGPHSPRPPAAD